MTALEQDIISMLERGGVSFAELSDIEGFKGDQEFGNTTTNVLFWTNMSVEACDILKRLHKAGVFHFCPTPLMVYIIDGRVLPMPIVKQQRRNRYKEPHWLPVSLNKGPEKAARARA